MSEATADGGDVAKRYTPSEVEERWYAIWEETDLFHSTPDPARQPYTIVIPPPNVTGILHMGHALNNTLQDILIRAARMRGDNALWVPGTDHAGIATQNVVERELQEEGLHREDLGREKFIARVWAWKEKYGATIIQQLKRLGCACDWRRTRFTMDEGLSRAVREVFVRLYREDLIYRGRRLIHWCCRCRTALADDEVEREDRAGKLWYIRYPLKGRRRCLVVATTRPETMLGDTAVAVHPDDDRYRDLVGATAILPILEREIPVVADRFVDPTFGTGVVKVTPAHDPNDFECGQRHGLAQIMVIGPDGAMTEAAGKYAGLDRFRCRERVLEELADKKLLEKETEHTHAVGQCYRCQSIVEPYLSEQWFVKMRPLADEAIAASRAGKIKFHPPRWERVYLSWLENVRDWCISRQIWWGHRLPVWYCRGCGHVNVEVEAPAACAKCGEKGLEQDPDVLDTWFSSALWPFSTLGWPERTPELAYYYPTTTLVTDRGIIYFWVARMVMMGLHFMGEVPFRHVYIHGTILDEHGAKMSKSAGNGIDPLVMIAGGTQRRFGKEQTFEGYGADAVRYTLCALATEGQDIRLSPTRFEMGRNFINKVWNACRFVCMGLAARGGAPRTFARELLRFEDRWILSRLSALVAEMTKALDDFRYSDLANAIYDFTWRDYCDWYVEIVKPRLKGDGDDATAAAVLAHVLDHILRLLHPISPMATEEMAQQLRTAAKWGQGDFLLRQPWPTAMPEWRDADSEQTMRLIQDAVRAVRNIRAKFRIPPRAKVEAVLSAANAETVARLEPHIDLIRSQALAEEVRLGHGLPPPPQAAATVLEGMQVFVPLAQHLDVDLERKRLMQERAKKEALLATVNSRLHNQEFLARAKPEVVERERERREELLRQIAELRDLAASLGNG